jgi:hypothetical protein
MGHLSAHLFQQPRARSAIRLAACLLGACLTRAAVFAEVTLVGGLTKERTAAPGETFDGQVLLRNSGDAPVEVKCYQTDYAFYADGKSVFGEPGKLPRSNAGWVTLSRDFQTVPPKETVGVSYTVQVPKQEGLKGTYWSMIMVESSGKPPELKEKGEKDIRVGITHVMRYGVQIVTHIGDTGEVKLKVLDKSCLLVDGKPFLRVDIENTGERWLRPAVWADVFDLEGKGLGRFEGREKRIFPGMSVRQEIALTDIPAGKYKALIVIDNGDENLFGARLNFEISEPEPKPKEGEAVPPAVQPP